MPSACAASSSGTSAGVTLGVPDAFGIDDHVRPVLAGRQAARRRDFDARRIAAPRQFLRERLIDPAPPRRAAGGQGMAVRAGVGADEEVGVGRGRSQRLRDLVIVVIAQDVDVALKGQRPVLRRPALGVFQRVDQVLHRQVLAFGPRV